MTVQNSKKITRRELADIRNCYVVLSQEGLDNWDRKMLYAAINGRTKLIQRLLDHIEAMEDDAWYNS